MKFNWVILVIPLFMASTITATSIRINRQTFGSCQPNECVITNITIMWANDTKYITANIKYNGNPNGRICKLRINISECFNYTECTGEPEVEIDENNCKCLDNMEMDTFAEEMSKVEMEKGWLTQRYGKTYGNLFFDLKFCIHLDKTNYDIDGNDNGDNPDNISGDDSDDSGSGQL